MATLLQLENLSKHFGTRVLLDRVSLTINEGQKIGCIGRNGAGKTTLLKMIIKQEASDTGRLIYHPILRLGYLEQHEDIRDSERVLDYLERVSGQPNWECAKMMAAFDLKGEQLQLPYSSLSGGYRMRVRLAGLFLRNPNLLLLDEPTNYLDLQTQLYLEQVLAQFRGSTIIVSHDREFLKRTCDHTLEIDQGDATLYPGGIEEYLVYKDAVRLTKERYNKSIEQQQKHLQTFIDRFRAKASKATQAQSKMKMLSRLEKIEIKTPLRRIRIQIPAVETRKSFALKTNHLDIGYGKQVIVDDITTEFIQGSKIAILGENGQGKSTFLKTLAGELSPLEGTYTFNNRLRFAYYHQFVQEHIPLRETVEGYLFKIAASDVEREQVLRMAGNFLFQEDDLKKSVSMLSGGEKARLYLAGMLLGAYDVLLLDEPTNHLDFETVEALGEALKDWNGTVFFVSHSRTFVQLLATHILEMRQGHAYPYAGTYEEYVWQQTQVTSSSLAQSTLTKELKKETTEEKIEYTKPEIHAKINTLKRQLRKLERDMDEFNKEKDQIMQYFLDHPTDFSKERNQRLTTLNNVLELTESEWLKVQHEIEGWELKLRKS